MIVKPHKISTPKFNVFESSVNSYDSQTTSLYYLPSCSFESSVNSYDSQTSVCNTFVTTGFESSVNSYDSQTKSL